ncbi:MAG: hypothetical protein ABEN55_20440 [Bradymonadaceae bacterium]
MFITHIHEQPFEPEHPIRAAPFTTHDIRTVLVRFFNSGGESTYCVEDLDGSRCLVQLDGREGTFVVRVLGGMDGESVELYRGDNPMEAAYAVVGNGQVCRLEGEPYRDLDPVQDRDSCRSGSTEVVSGTSTVA